MTQLHTDPLTTFKFCDKITLKSKSCQISHESDFKNNCTLQRLGGMCSTDPMLFSCKHLLYNFSGSAPALYTPNASLLSKCSTQYLHLYQLLLVMMQSCLIPPIMIVPLKNMLAMSLCPLNVSRLQESSPHWLYLMSPCSFIQMRLPSPQIVSCLRQSSYVCHGQWYMYLILYMYTIANSNLCIIRSLTPSHVT